MAVMERNGRLESYCEEHGRWTVDGICPAPRPCQCPYKGRNHQHYEWCPKSAVQRRARARSV